MMSGRALTGTGLALLLVLAGGSATAHAETDQAVSETPVTPEEPVKRKPLWKSLVPVPVIITEPAIGEGLGLALAYFHPDKSKADYSPRTVESPSAMRDISVARKPPPKVTGAFGAVTSNGTYAGGVGHINSFRNDTIRYAGVGAYANVVADFYLLDQSFEFNLEGILIYQDLKFRVAQSDWFLGFAISYLDATNEFKLDVPEDPGWDQGFLPSEFQDVGLTGRAMYETRDNTLMPNTGQLFDFSVSRYDTGLGGDYDYTLFKARLLSFHRLHERLVLGLRAEAKEVAGEPPFFGVPWVSLRGIPAMRYQGDRVLVAEVEGRFNFDANWAMVGFGGKGWTRRDVLGIENDDSVEAWGVGGRYHLLKDEGVWVGLDWARGPEDDVWYVQVGHPW
jgi:hypothetical protein